MNSVTFCGRVVADAEVKQTNSGNELCKFRLASDTGWGDQKRTHWLDAAFFGKRGVAIAPHLRKGQQVTVIGELDPPRTYQTQNGDTRVAQDLIVREIALQGARGDSEGQAGSTHRGRDRTPPAAPYGGGTGGGGFSDDIPFSQHMKCAEYLA